MCRLSGGKMKCAYRDYGILRRGVPFGVILERSEGGQRPRELTGLCIPILFVRTTPFGHPEPQDDSADLLPMFIIHLQRL